MPKDHPLRAIRRLVTAALEQLSPKLDAVYASGGRPSIAPEKLWYPIGCSEAYPAWTA